MKYFFMASLIIKWQRCGKSTCRCIEGFPHGPYFWLVTYISRNSQLKQRGKYKWKYLGKRPEDAWSKLVHFDQRFHKSYSLDKLKHRINLLHKLRNENKNSRMSDEVFTIDD
ncbi:DUF6788 family protein [Candidatus Hodarchaeum mangrovi]